MTSAEHAEMPGQGVGLRLKQAREAAGLGVDELAAKMRVPVRVVESLEAEHWEHLGAAVFVRGYLRSYARATGLAEDSLQSEPRVPVVAPPSLRPRTFTPRYRRLAEQAARRMVYVVITATLAVPVWMVTRGHMEATGHQSASLDLSVESALPQGRDARSGVRRQPYVASMTPIQPRRQTVAAAVADDVAGAASALSLKFSDDSWVDIRARDGRLLEQALVKGGESRSYDAGEVGHVVLGNAGAVEVLRYGDIQDIAPYRRANVARFTVSSDGSLTPQAE